MLFREGIKTDMPNVHQNTLNAFNKFLVKTGKLDVALLKIYEETLIKADILLGIFALEKGKRGEFTYEKLPQANLAPSNESFNNASLFFKTISQALRRK